MAKATVHVDVKIEPKWAFRLLIVLTALCGRSPQWLWRMVYVVTSVGGMHERKIPIVDAIMTHRERDG